MDSHMFDGFFEGLIKIAIVALILVFIIALGIGFLLGVLLV